MAHKFHKKFLVLLAAALIVDRETALVGAQLPVQPQLQSPVVRPQLQVVTLSQPQSQTTRPPSTTTTKPVLSQIGTKLEIKPIIKINAPLKWMNTNGTITAKPKSSMRIVKAPESKSSDDSPDKGLFSSLVSVDRAQNKSKVGVHIPLIFDMTNDKDTSSGKSKLDLTVLGGLVTVNGDRENGKGPLTVTVFGIPVYTATGNAGGLQNLASRLQSTLTEGKRRFDDSIDTVAGSRQLPDATMQLYSNVKRTGEKGVMSLTDQLDKVSSFLKERATPITNTNGKPASRSDLFVTKPPQLRPTDLKPSITETTFKKFASNNNITAHDLHLQSL